VAAHEATLRFSYADADLAATVASAIELDAGDIEGERSEASVDREDATVRVRIDAADPAALRAAKRTWSNAVAAAEATAVAAA